MLETSKLKIHKTENCTKASCFHISKGVRALQKKKKSLMLLLTLHFSHLQLRSEAFLNLGSETGKTHEVFSVSNHCV